MNPLNTKHYSLAARKGFTLIEMLLVLALIALLAAIIIVYIDPARQLASSRNALRVSHLHTIVDALYQYSIDMGGNFPAPISNFDVEICRTEALSCAGLVDLRELTASKKYLVSVPTDPLIEQGNGSGYTIRRDEGRLGAVAIYAELGKVINIIR